MTVSIMIPHYGAQELLQACLAAIWANTAMEVEVVVVDNGTGHPIDADVVIRNEDNLGFAAACNQGAAASSGEHLCFLNNDTEVRGGWLEPLVAHLERGAGIVGSLLLYPDGQIQHAGVRLYRDQNGILMAENRRQAYAQGEVDAVTGACMAVLRDVFFQAGGFDEGFWNGAEDVDFCLQVRSLGYRCVYEPASVVTHRESVSGPERWRKVRENVARFHQKWGSTSIPLPLVRTSD